MSGAYLTLEELESFLKEKGDEVFTYLKILCRDSEQAEDLAQTVLLKFLEQVEKARVRRETAAGYLIQMCRNEYISTLRKKESVPLGGEELQADQRKEKIESNSREIRSILMETLADPQMPADAAEVIRFRFLYEIHPDEISQRTGKSRATIHRLMQKGLNCLHDAFRRRGYDVSDLE